MSKTEMQFADVGTVSSGTMRARDLLGTFSLELENLVARNRLILSHTEKKAFGDLVQEARSAMADTDTDTAEAILDELFDALDHFAPEGCYFGAHPGDGADYGFWPVDDECACVGGDEE